MQSADQNLDDLLRRMAQSADRLNKANDWPREQLQWCAEHGVFRWFVPREFGGWDWTTKQVIEGYLRLSAACLTTTFAITQRASACQRIAASDNQELKSRLLPELATGESSTTLGISQLTTSRRHLHRPALMATRIDGGWRLDGCSPWVTGARFSDTIVIGAEIENGNQMLFAVSTKSHGLVCEKALPLMALSASQTGRVNFHDVEIADQSVIAGPAENVLSKDGNPTTGGLPTSALALGLSATAIDYLREQAVERRELRAPANALRTQFETIKTQLLARADGQDVVTNDDLRASANSLALRSTRSAIVAAKGEGFVDGHAAGRWCREALFFLVWSCPQGVLQTHLCELAGINDLRVAGRL
jgi:alkylation response protein AidB-like acyl-CoA dehydrogenase